MAREKCITLWFGRFGLKHQTLKHSDYQFKIDINKKIESLNISNSVSVVCHYIDTILKPENE